MACIISVMFAGAEMAISSISRDSIEHLVELKSPGAPLALTMTRNKRRFILTLAAGRISAIVLGTASCIYLLILSSFPSAVAIVTGGVITLAVFTLTESILAKIVSVGEYESLIARFSTFLFPFFLLFFPFTMLMDMLLSGIIKEKADLAAKEEAFIELVKSQSESGVLEREEGEMIKSIFEFSDTTVREVMVPRIDMIAAEKNMVIDDLLALFRRKGHSRIPVYDGRIDNIIGLIYAKDLLARIAEHGKDSFSVTEAMRNAYFVPENKKISELLKEFKQAKVHIAVVVDEYGGTAGIVALEDLLEEIVGEIQDEYDAEDERDYIKINERSYLMDAGLDIDDVNNILRSDIPNEDFDTLAGFIYHQLGFIPEGGEVITWDRYTFTIKEINGNRISKVLVQITETTEKSEKPSSEM
jgi:putative hemolysin